MIDAPLTYIQKLEFGEGIFPIFKPIGWSSYDVIRRMKQLTSYKKIGHAGTLDPAASGLLIIAIGRNYTRTIDEFMGAEKEYLATICLGIETKTYDQEGEIVSQVACTTTQQQLLEILPQFQGKINQIPPMYSALKHKGKRLYELARKGISIERAPREIIIHQINLLDFHIGSYPTATLHIICSKGTYIRSLAHDIGQVLGVGGSLTQLTRTRIGTYTLNDCYSIES